MSNPPREARESILLAISSGPPPPARSARIPSPFVATLSSEIPGMSGTLKFGIPNPPPDLDGDEPEGDPPPRSYSARVFCA